MRLPAAAPLANKLSRQPRSPRYAATEVLYNGIAHCGGRLGVPEVQAVGWKRQVAKCYQ
jgi:hypothetical protein